MYRPSQAVPCQAIEGVPDRTHSCEPNPDSMFNAYERISSRGLVVVGWYHRCDVVCDGGVCGE